jgi:RimJ/RimL family protein N-acetyltransferase
MFIPAQGKLCSKSSDIHIRDAVAADSLLLWKWANDPVTRANSFRTKAISWNEHQRWYAKRLASLDCRLWIMELKNVPVGQIRYDRITIDVAQVGFSVAHRVRGKGFGTLLLETTAPMASSELKVRWVRGITLSGNLASQRAFAKAKFTLFEQRRIGEHECFVFQRGV